MLKGPPGPAGDQPWYTQRHQQVCTGYHQHLTLLSILTAFSKSSPGPAQLPWTSTGLCPLANTIFLMIMDPLLYCGAFVIFEPSPQVEMLAIIIMHEQTSIVESFRSFASCTLAW